MRRLVRVARGQDAAPELASHEHRRPGQPRALVRSFWIDVISLGQHNQWPGTDDDSQLQMRAGPGRPLTALLNDYATQAARNGHLDILRELADGITGV